MKKLEIWIALSIVSLVVATARGTDESCCSHCGCNCNVHAVCRLKCETKKVPKITYSCECEDFCVPGVSKKCGTVTETDAFGCEHCKPNWIPQCAKVHTRTKLVKHVTEKEEKSYKWVVEYMCDRCATGCANCSAGGAATNNGVQTPTADNQAMRQPEAPLLDR